MKHWLPSRWFKPDLLLLDVMLPDIDGPQTLAALRMQPEAEQLPVIFLTAKVQVHEVARYKALWALEVITKPFNAITLAAQISEIWMRQEAVRDS